MRLASLPVVRPVMRQFIESLSWTSGFFVVALLSAVAALLTGRVSGGALRWSATALVPIAISYCLYWLPDWLGVGSPEYSSWVSAIVIPWSFVGVLVSTVVTIAVRQHLRAKHATDQ